MRGTLVSLATLSTVATFSDDDTDIDYVVLLAREKGRARFTSIAESEGYAR
ncbi:hypothetical protein HS125_06835 [bacterium]|nr:hypothetical protein [bacterium]